MKAERFQGVPSRFASVACLAAVVFFIPLVVTMDKVRPAVIRHRPLSLADPRRLELVLRDPFVNQPSPQEFLEACGARGPLVLESEHVGQPESVRQTLSLPFALIGRHQRADLRLDDQQVSRRHAYLQVVAGRPCWVHLRSRLSPNGPVNPLYGLLHHSPVHRIGPFIVRLAEGVPSTDDPELPPNPLASESYDPSTLPRVGLDFLRVKLHPSRWVLDRVLTLVGRAPLCPVRLHSPMVSHIHCALLHTPAGLWVVDLLGRQGIAVNGTVVRWALLEDADELCIGPFLIRVQILDRPPAVAVSAPVAPPLARSPQTLDPLGEEGTTKSDRTRKVVQSPTPSLVPSSLPTDLEGMLSALAVASTPSGVASTVGGAAEELLLPMMRQFSLMQQQMFDQFQQALLQIVQLFRDLHHDQLQLIRQELHQLSELTWELKNLQTEQARQTPAVTGQASDGSPKSPSVASLEPSAATVSSPGGETPPLPPAPCVSRSAEATPALTTEGSGRSPEEIHGWLAQRLASLQQERQSRWERILHILTGR
jgi:pSer/pThr/pTyr-binding forkhead associated (FHA) protein